MNRQQAIELVRKTFESPFERQGYIRFLRELLNGFDDEGARVNQGARIPEKFQDYVEKMERVGKYAAGKTEIMLFIVYLKRETSIERARTMQRNFVAWYLSQGNKDAALVAFVSPNSVDWRFSLVKMDYRFEEQDGKTKVREEFTPARRWSFLVGKNEKSHTAQSRFAKIIEDDEHNPTLAQLADAFNVEPVTKEFFQTFREIFEEVEATIERRWSEEQKRLYTQRFFNRLLFIVFLEHKGWLTFNGRRDYLRALFEDYYKNTRDKNANFHRSRLNTLFFMGLNHPSGDKRQKAEYKPILGLIGDVPYLNGGLFEEEEDDRDGPAFPDAIIAKVLNELVYQFNFTVTESTPLDVEVAVDPEMLGRIFEELVTGRHESGSYYTPKPVVAFMCREALKGYLETTVGRNSFRPDTGRNEFRGTGEGESAEAIALFVDKNDAKSIRNPMQVVDALRAVKVCDPACGSGAYLLGMLHELLEQYAVIFAQHQKDGQTIYQTKLDIIQNNLYGVDKDDFAVNIARLRLWLSLIVDFEGGTPPPLPNLDFKIECGDSLTAPDPSGGLNLGFRSQLVDDFLLAKNQFTTAHHSEKKELKEQVNKLRDDIKAWSGRKASFNGFDWTIEFAEIFIKLAATTTMTGAMAGLVNTSSGQMELAVTPPAKTGFDVILANPPYVRADAPFNHIGNEKERQKEISEWQIYRKHLKDSKVYTTIYEKWDLYIPFLERAYQLLSHKGQMVFIIPDAFNTAKYANKSHEFFLEKSNVIRIDFCSEIDLFNAGVNNTILHFAKATPTNEHTPIRVRRWGDKPEKFEQNIEVLGSAPQVEFGTALFRQNELKPSDDISDFIHLEKICYISKGMVIHSEEDQHRGLFTKDDLISDVKDAKHPKPFIEGKDVVKWWIWRHKYLEYGTSRSPALLSRPTFPELYDVSEKILAVKVSIEVQVAYDDRQLRHNEGIFSLVPWHYLKDVRNGSIRKFTKYRNEVKPAEAPPIFREELEKISKQYNVKYILAIMNSAFAKKWLSSRRRHKLQLYPDDWKQLPIAPIPLEEQKEFVKLVDKILGEYEKQGYPLPEKSAEKVREWEGQLDEMVGKLYE